MIVKEKLYAIINNIQDERKLQGYYNLLVGLESLNDGDLYKSLTVNQKSELELSYTESFNESQLLDHDNVKSNFIK